MKTQLDPVLNEASKEKRSQTLQAKKNHRELEEHIDRELDRLISLKNKAAKGEVRSKSDKVFRNHYKNFQYDYEEDLYEPGYDEEEE